MKKVLIPAIVVVALAISYFFVIFMPSQQVVKLEQEKQDFLFNKQTECMEICRGLYEEEKDYTKAGDVLNPEYAYNEEENACFYAGGVLLIDTDYFSKRVVNCQTNEEVLTYITINDEVFTNFCDTCVSSIKEYESLKNHIWENNLTNQKGQSWLTQYT